MAKSWADMNRPLIYYTVSGLIAGAGIGIAYANLLPLKFGHGMAIAISFGILNVWIWHKLGVKDVIMPK